jgi:Xaa-Pro aminopeptidase
MDVARIVRSQAQPGVNVQSLVDNAQSVAADMGFQLWDRFLGHGLGLDVHSRPDMGFESMELKENMVFTIEPRIALDGYLYGNEDMILLTAGGAESLTNYPWNPFEV